MQRVSYKWYGYIFLLASLMGALINAEAQVPFDCSGRMFRVVEVATGTAFEEIELFKNDQAIQFKSLAVMPGVSLNGICYRPTDNLIYGLQLGDSYQLIQIDAAYELRILKDLPLPNQLLFVSGDISPDGRYLVLLGFSQTETSNLLALVDLEDPNFSTQILPLTTSSSGASVFCADVAFHPTTGELFGFDHREGRLLKIDINSRTIDDQTYAKTLSLTGNMPSLFFNAAGQLFGIASPTDMMQSRSFYELDLQTGRAKELQALGVEFNQDACSCPFEVNLYNRVSNRKAFPCTEISFTLTIVNQSPFVQSNLRLRDTFYSGIEITEIIYPAFNGRILSGVGTNILALDGFDVPIGTDSIVVKLKVPETISYGVYANRTYLYNVNSTVEGNSEMRLSDDPATAQVNDPTYYEVNDLAINFEDDFPIICAGEEVELDVRIEGAESYLWSTGEQTPRIKVAEEGIYDVSVNTSCGAVSGSIYVAVDDLGLDLGEAVLEAEEGERITLSGDIRSYGSAQYYYWSTSDPNETLSCITCPNTQVKAKDGAQYFLEVANENGCRTSDSIKIYVQPFDFYVPNAFSPDGNGVNETFFLFGKKDFQILNFGVYNRWGAQVYFQEEGQANDPNFGWDGRYQGEMANAGVYIWGAKVQTANGQIKHLSGEINLIR